MGGSATTNDATHGVSETSFSFDDGPGESRTESIVPKNVEKAKSAAAAARHRAPPDDFEEPPTTLYRSRSRDLDLDRVGGEGEDDGLSV
jgi:hypothetical protein